MEAARARSSLDLGLRGLVTDMGQFFIVLSIKCHDGTGWKWKPTLQGWTNKISGGCISSACPLGPARSKRTGQTVRVVLLFVVPEKKVGQKLGKNTSKG